MTNSGREEYPHVRTLSTNEAHPNASALICFILESNRDDRIASTTQFDVWGDIVTVTWQVDDFEEDGSLVIIN
jgi:hypothetical protein